MTAPSTDRIAVTLFCGGRGAATIARELIRRPGVELTLLINGYDNGLSTGAVRAFLPGMLGPSDFRKSLSHHLDPADPPQAALRALLEFRFGPAATDRDLADLHADLVTPTPATDLVTAVAAQTRHAIAGELAVFLDHLAPRREQFDLSDCSLGNLVIAGAYLRCGRDFNAAIERCAQLVRTPGRIINVTNGENAFLVAVKEDGEILADEADVVAPQSRSRITDLYLLRDALTPEQQAALGALTVADRHRALRRRQAEVTLNEAARVALRDADVIVYSPGTPHSSLLPSYLTPGIADEIATSRARARVFLVNILADHDVAHFTAPELVDSTLGYLGDPRNERTLITHVLSHRGEAHSAMTPDVPAAVVDGGGWAGAEWIHTDLEHALRRGRHCGQRTVSALADLVRRTSLLRAG